MRKSRFTEARIIGMIKECEAGLPTVPVTYLTMPPWLRMRAG